MIAWDTETFLVEPGLLAPPLVCVSYADSDGRRGLLPKDAGARFIEYAMSIGEVLIGHRVAYDFAVLCAHRPDLIPAVFAHYAKGLVRDTSIRQELLDIAAGRRQDNGQIFVFRDRSWQPADYSLAGGKRKGTTGLVGRYLGKDRSADKGAEGWQLRYAELDGVPLPEWPAEAKQYAQEDAADTLAVYLAQAPAPHDIVNEIEQARAAWALHLMSTWGVRTDGPMVADLEAALTKEHQRTFSRLRKAGFYKTKRAPKGKTPDFYEDSKKGPRPMVFSKDLAAVQAAVTKAYARSGQPAPRTATGVATDKDTLIQSGSILLATLAEAGGVSKLLTTYVPVLKQGSEVPINARFNTLVNSGRTSASAPNLQNLPTGRRVGGVRECFVPRPGFLYVSTDYETIELRALAQVCLTLFGHSAMADALREGRDLHLQMAAELLGITYEEAKTAAKEPKVKEARQMAKALNFGYPGGLGASTFVDFARASYGVVVTEAQATRLKKQWLETWPEMNLYFKYINARVGNGNGSLTQHVSNRVRGGMGFCDGANTLFQGLAADGAKNALFRVAHECYVDQGTALFGTRPVVFVHDEIIAEVPADIAHEASERLAVVMCQAMAEYVPDVPITAKPALMERWLKAAEPVYANGRLVPWTIAA